MGLDVHGIRFLIEAKLRGVSFEHAATIGRQSLHINAQAIAELTSAYGIPISEPEAARLIDQDHGFCEPLLQRLGAGEVTSIDMSAYQHASLIHDMNQPLPAALEDRFSVVIDGGSLEHVFNFPQAIANCMKAVRRGGHFIGVTPANNFLGHGFYQFSPELYFRVFSEPSGFAVDRMVIYQECWPNRWYDVEDPATIKQRVTLVNRYPTYLLVLARKTADVPLFHTTPQQSDYVSWWSDAHAESAPSIRHRAARQPGFLTSLATRVASYAGRYAPDSWKNRYHRFRAEENRFNPAFFKKVAPWSGTQASRRTGR